MIDSIPTIEDLGDLEGKTVLVRVDINCALDPETKRISDATRIRRSLPTLKELSERGAKIVVIAHQGDPGVEFIPLEEHAQIISKQLNKEVRYVEDLFGPAALDAIKGLKKGEILLLENLRIFSEETLLYEERLQSKSELFAKSLLVQKLTPLVDAYVNDAFATAQRAHPSTVGFPKVLPSAAGRLMQEEIQALSKVMRPERPCVFCLGGLKIGDAFKILGKVVGEGAVDEVLTFGMVGEILLKAQGVDLGSPTETFIKREGLERYVSAAQGLMVKYKKKIKVPSDVAVGIDGRQEVNVEALPVDAMIGDIGSRTIEGFIKEIRRAKTVFMNGPPGIFEKPVFASGTKRILEAIAANPGFTVIGGGHTIAAAEKFKLSHRFSFVSTGGGALIRYVSGERLASIEALRKEKGPRKGEKRAVLKDSQPL